MADNLQVKAEKLLNYGKTQLRTKGVTSAATTVRQVLDDISDIQTGGGSGTDRLQWKCDNMKSLAYECYNSKLNNVDEMFNGLDTSSVTDMSHMFYSCKSLTSLNVSNFNTSSVTDMSHMFQNCNGLTSLDLSNFDTSQVTNMGYMFSNRGLTQILGSLDLIKTTSLYAMFNNCRNLTTFTLKNIKKSLTIGSGTSYGTLLDDPTIINTAKELWDLTGSTGETLTVATAVSAKLDTIYVKLIDATEEMIANDPNITSKKPCEVCSETDEGAMTLREYIVSKNWTISG